MAFTITDQGPTAVEVVGSFAQARWGVVALSNGTATVTIPGASLVQAAFASSQTANAARVSATATNTFTITGTGTDVVMWFCICRGGV